MSYIEKVCHNNKFIYFFQDDDSFKITTDNLLLSKFVKIHSNDHLLVDFGTGNAVLLLLLSTQTKISMLGLEIDKDIALIAKEAVKYNHLEKQISILNVKIQDSCSYIQNNSVDIVISNPPYFRVTEKSKLNVCTKKSIARHEIMITFEEMSKEANRILKNNGRFLFIHRVERMVEVFSTLKKFHLEPKRMSIIYDKIDTEPTLFLLEAVKNGNSTLKIEKPIIIKE